MALKELGNKKYRWEIEDFSGGLNLFKEPTKLNDNEFLIFENLITYKEGAYFNATKRGGIERYNTNTFGSAGHKILSISQFITTGQSSNINRIIVNTSDTKLKYCEGTGVPAQISSSEYNNKYRYVTYKDKHYVINRDSGAASNYVYDGTNYLEMGCPPCFQTFSLEAISTGALNGNYTYLITFKYDNNQESWFIPHNVNTNADAQRPNGAVMGDGDYASLIQISTGGAKKVKITGIPTGNARVTARVIYRTKTVGTVLYYHSTINDNTTTTYIDNLADTDLVEAIDLEYVYKPYTAQYGTVHANRLILGNVRENQYAAIASVAGVSMAGSTVGGNQLTTDATRVAKYSYKFAKDFKIPTLSTLAAAGNFAFNYSGVFSPLSSIVSKELGSGENTNTITAIPNDDPWSGHTALFRNTCQFINAVSLAGTTITITITNAVAQHIYQIGEVIHITGIGTYLADGDYTVTGTPAANQVDIFWAGAVGLYTANTGRIEGGRYYFLGLTAINGTSFVDGVTGTGDSDMALSSNSSFLNSGITISTGNKNFSSMIKVSMQNKGDISPAEYEHNINQEDGDEITGIYTDEDSILILKDRNLYKLYSNSEDVVDWVYRPVIQGIGHTQSVTNCKGFGADKIRKGEYLFFMNNTVYHYRQGNAYHCSKKIQTLLDSLTFTNLDIKYYAAKNWIIVIYSTSSINGDILIYDLNEIDEEGNGSWYRFPYNATANINLQLRAPFILKDGTPIFGSEQPYLMKYNEGANDDSLWNGSAFADTDIKGQIKLKQFETGYMSISRVFLKARCSSVSGTADALKIDMVTDIFGTKALTGTLKTLTELEIPVNAQGRNVTFLIYDTENLNFSIFYFAFDFKPIHGNRGLLKT